MKELAVVFEEAMLPVDLEWTVSEVVVVLVTVMVVVVVVVVVVVTVVVVEEDKTVLVVDGFVAAEGVGSGVVGTSTAQTSA